MGRFATGVTVITTAHEHDPRDDGERFLSVSLRPPLVLVSLGRCRMREMLPRSGRYGVSVLAHDQGTSPRTSPPRSRRRRAQFTCQDGVPLLEGALAHLVCRVVDVHRAGDHALWIGEVEHLDQRDGEPLLFYTGRFGTMDRSPR